MNRARQLKEIIRRQAEQIQRQTEQIQRQAEQISFLLAENAQLRVRIKELEDAMKATSKTSSKPPSSDGFKKQPALPRVNSGKQGGQKGHVGRNLEPVKEPDHIKEHHPLVCTCGHNLSNTLHSLSETRQVFGLPPTKLEVTEHRKFSCKCPNCGSVQSGNFPSNVRARTQYGESVIALCTLLNNGHKLSVESIQDLFNDLYGYSINPSTILSANERMYESLAESEEKIKQYIIDSDVVHFDETGCRIDGSTQWIHTASTDTYTYLFPHKKRGRLVWSSPDSILSKFQGWFVHDCYSSYFSFKKDKDALCGAHLLRELSGLHECGSEWAFSMHTFLMLCYHHSDDGRKTVDNPERTRHIYDILCRRANEVEPYNTTFLTCSI